MQTIELIDTLYLARDKDNTLKLFNNIPSYNGDRWLGNHYLSINSKMYPHVEPGTYQCVEFEDLFTLPLGFDDDNDKK